MKKISPFFLLFFLTACDPGHHGVSHLKNGSSYVLKLKYKALRGGNPEVKEVMVAPGEYIDFNPFGGLGAAEEFSCCPCEYRELSLTVLDSSKVLLKDIHDPAQWRLDNPNQQRFSNKQIDCYFKVEESDIQ